ncbi:hypothetical protein KB206_16220 [Microvirga sp. STS02]|uniref:hypothetical protein n=1 Tax=Hymenobacter negativus TaxID=2795026 RepID=UPI0018DD66DD|nr:MULTISPECIES: hypothetical protein [Bacteria]MBH8570440.1 hypothetical protein [Hymenobacter negativus]MBR7210179.1 hypothetical protein [Microvirga sp. STS02]
MRFADGEQDKHRPIHLSNAKNLLTSTNRIRLKIDLYPENLHLINLHVGRKSSREVVSKYILPNEAFAIAQVQKLDYATGIKFGHRRGDYLRSRVAKVRFLS